MPSQFNTMSEKNELLFVADMNCDNVVEIIKKCDDNFFAHPYRWIWLGDDFSQAKYREIIENIEALPDSNIILAEKKMNNNKHYNLKQFYKTDQIGKIIYENYGSWDKIDGLVDGRTTGILSRRRKNLQYKILTASVVITNNDTFNHLTDYKDGHVDSIAKVNYILTNQLMEIVNATKRFTFVSSWGLQNRSTDEWNGMVGALTRKEADIGGTALFVTLDRVPFIDYISMTTPSKAAFVFRAPPLSYVTNIFYLPFDSLVWICCLTLVALCCIILFLTWKYSPANNENVNDVDGADKISINNRLRLSDVALLTMGAITQMGSSMEPKIMSSRISSFFLFLSLFFLYTSYTANIVALLQSSTKGIKTLSDLLDSQLEFGVDDTVYNHYYFSVATDPVRQAIYQRKIVPPKQPERFMNMTEGVSKLRKGLFVFHMETGSGYKLVEETFFEHEKCGLMEIEFIQVTHPWYAIQKHSPYKEILKVNLFKIREYGLQAREILKIYTKKPKCDSHGQNFGSVRLLDCYMAGVILLIGFFIAIIVFCIERKLKKNSSFY